MNDLMVQIDGETVPLASCGWLMRETCGCIVAALVAAPTRGIVYATAEQAHQHLEPNKRIRDKDVREGRHMELITMAHYRSNIRSNWECEQHAAAAS